MVILSKYQTAPLLALRGDPQSVTISADLNRSQIEATLDDDGLQIGSQLIDWPTLIDISQSDNNCFLIEDGAAEKIAAFSELTNRYYSLYPTASAPTMLVAGFPMHRIKNTDPMRDTLAKLKAVKPVVGQALDTCTGLGYTAIELGKSAEKTITIELDPAAQSICRLNPWTAELFSNPHIEQRIGDAFDEVPHFADSQFSRIIHDPPTFALAGHLYSAEFYAHLWRILARGGKLFHYIGDPSSRSGRNTTRGVVERLKQVGFKRVSPAPYAFGVLAKK